MAWVLFGDEVSKLYLDQFCWWLLQYARATTILLCVQQLFRAYNKENIKAKRSCPFVMRIIVLPGIPITKGQ